MCRRDKALTTEVKRRAAIETEPLGWRGRVATAARTIYENTEVLMHLLEEQAKQLPRDTAILAREHREQVQALAHGRLAALLLWERYADEHARAVGLRVGRR